MTTDARENQALQSTLTPEGQVRVTLDIVELKQPGPDEILVRMEAVPVNPSDLGIMLGGADLSTLAVHDGALTAHVPAIHRAGAKANPGAPSRIGYEGAGIVIQAGAGAEHLLDRKVAIFGFGTFCRYMTVPAAGVVPLPEEAAVTEGAALFVNPLTALSMVETMRQEGHTALVHTAAASNLGQMLNKICIADGVDLVNIVRRPEQVDLLKGIGANYVVNSSSADFNSELADAVAATGATIAFDAVGGGMLANDILRAMEQAATSGEPGSVYGSSLKKQVYIYGMLDPSPTLLDRGYGMAWNVGGYVLTTFLDRAGPAGFARLCERVVRERNTTFASRYVATVGLTDMLVPETLRAMYRQSTGRKYLLDPGR